MSGSCAGADAHGGAILNSPIKSFAPLLRTPPPAASRLLFHRLPDLLKGGPDADGVSSMLHVRPVQRVVLRSEDGDDISPLVLAAGLRLPAKLLEYQILGGGNRDRAAEEAHRSPAQTHSGRTDALLSNQKSTSKLEATCTALNSCPFAVAAGASLPAKSSPSAASRRGILGCTYNHDVRVVRRAGLSISSWTRRIP